MSANGGGGRRRRRRNRRRQEIAMSKTTTLCQKNEEEKDLVLLEKSGFWGASFYKNDEVDAALPTAPLRVKTALCTHLYHFQAFDWSIVDALCENGLDFNCFQWVMDLIKFENSHCSQKIVFHAHTWSMFRHFFVSRHLNCLSPCEEEKKLQLITPLLLVSFDYNSEEDDNINIYHHHISFVIKCCPQLLLIYPLKRRKHYQLKLLAVCSKEYVGKNKTAGEEEDIYLKTARMLLSAACILDTIQLVCICNSFIVSNPLWRNLIYRYARYVTLQMPGGDFSPQLLLEILTTLLELSATYVCSTDSLSKGSIDWFLDQIWNRLSIKQKDMLLMFCLQKEKPPYILLSRINKHCDSSFGLNRDFFKRNQKRLMYLMKLDSQFANKIPHSKM